MIATLKAKENDVPEVEQEVLKWNEDDLPKVNYRNLGQRLANCDDLYRCPEYAGGLLVVLNDGDHRKITTGKALSPSSWIGCQCKYTKMGNQKAGEFPLPTWTRC